MGVGDTWGTREELLHPRDSKGRFRSTWKMASGVVDKILSALSSFNPKTFTSEDEARGYVGTIAQSDKYLTNRKTSVANFMRGFTQVNDSLRAGKQTPASREMDKAMRPLPDDLILTQVVGPESFGLDAQSLPQIEELTGKLVRDKGYNPMNVGAPVPHGPGQVTLSIATPAGTKAIAPSTGQPTRELILDRDLPLRVTKVKADGQGGFYVYAVATDASDGETPVDIRSAVPDKGVEEAPEVGTPGPGGQGTGAGDLGIPAARGPGRPAGPGPGERNDGHVGVVGQGKAADGQAVGTPGEPAPEIPDVPEAGPDSRNTFKDAFEQSDLKVPSVGTRRKEFNDAYLGVASGKKTPQEAVRDLENRIAIHKKTIASDSEDGTDSGPLPEDVRRMEALTDLIKEHFNFTGRKQFKGGEEKKEPAKKAAAPAKKAAAPKAAPEKAEAEVDARIARADRGRKATIRRELREAREQRGEKTTKAAPRKAAAEVPLAEPTDEGKAVRDQWLSDAGVNYDDLSDTEKVGVNLMADQVAAGKVTRAEARRRFADSKFDNLKKISGSVTSRPAKKATKAAVKKTTPAKRAAPRKPEVGAAGLDLMTIPELRETARENGIKIPSSIRRKADIIDYLKDPSRHQKVGEKAPEKKAVPGKAVPEKKAAAPRKKTPVDRSAQEKEENGFVQSWVKATGNKAVRGFADDLRSRDESQWTAFERFDVARQRRRTLDRLRTMVDVDMAELDTEDHERFLRRNVAARVRVYKRDDLVADPSLDRLEKAAETGDIDRFRAALDVADRENDARLRAARVDLGKEMAGGRPKSEKGLLFMTIPELRQKAKDNDLKIPSPLRKKADIVDWLADALTAKERGEEPRVVKTQRQLDTEERARVRRREQEDRQAARMQLAGERRRQREAEVQARKDQREAARREKAAQAEQERIRKQQEREAAKATREQEAQERKRLAQEKREQGKREKKAADSVDYDTLKGWKVSELRELARQWEIRIPSSLRDIEEIREFVVAERNKKQAKRMADTKSGRQMLSEALDEGLDVPQAVRSKGVDAIARYITEQRQVLFDMGIDPKKYKPRGVISRMPGDTEGAGFGSQADWDKVMPRDSDPNHPMIVSNAEHILGYEIKHGVTFRRKGITYTIEFNDEKDVANPYAAARIVRDFEEFHESLPDGTKFQHHYRWLRRQNPGDPYWQRKFNNPDHKALASAGRGIVDVWNINEWTPNYHQGDEKQMFPKEIFGSLRHEFGHNVDQYDERARGGLAYSSDDPRWFNAADTDFVRNRHSPSFTGLAYNYAIGGHPIDLTEGESGRGYPNGVTTYGKSSAHEDFAESVRLYLSKEPVAWRRVGGRNEAVYFRDLFPNRAKLIDRYFPQVMALQKRGVYDY